MNNNFVRFIIVLLIIGALAFGWAFVLYDGEGHIRKDPLGSSKSITVPNHTYHLGDIENSSIYRFRDGDTTCYLVNGWKSTVSIDCIETEPE